MTYEEMKAISDAIASALRGGGPEFDNVDAQPFDPGELPEIMLTVNGEDVFLTIGPI